MTERDRLISELDEIMRRAEAALQRLEARQCATNRTTPARPKLTIVKGGLLAAIAVCGVAGKLASKASTRPGVVSSAAATVVVGAVTLTAFILGPDREHGETDLPGAFPAELTVSPPPRTSGSPAPDLREASDDGGTTHSPASPSSPTAPAVARQAPPAETTSSLPIPAPRQPNADAGPRPATTTEDGERDAGGSAEQDSGERSDEDEDREGTSGRESKTRDDRARCLDVEPDPAVDREACDSSAGGR